MHNVVRVVLHGIKRSDTHNEDVAVAANPPTPMVIPAKGNSHGWGNVLGPVDLMRHTQHVPERGLHPPPVEPVDVLRGGELFHFLHKRVRAIVGIGVIKHAQGPLVDGFDVERVAGGRMRRANGVRERELFLRGVFSEAHHVRRDIDARHSRDNGTRKVGGIHRMIPVRRTRKQSLGTLEHQMLEHVTFEREPV